MTTEPVIRPACAALRRQRKASVRRPKHWSILVAYAPFRALPGILRTARAHNNLGVRDAARQAGVSSSTFSRVECRKMCDARTYVKLSVWGIRNLPEATSGGPT